MHLANTVTYNKPLFTMAQTAVRMLLYKCHSSTKLRLPKHQNFLLPAVLLQVHSMNNDANDNKLVIFIQYTSVPWFYHINLWFNCSGITCITCYTKIQIKYGFSQDLNTWYEFLRGLKYLIQILPRLVAKSTGFYQLHVCTCRTPLDSCTFVWVRQYEYIYVCITMLRVTSVLRHNFMKSLNMDFTTIWSSNFDEFLFIIWSLVRWPCLVSVGDC